MYAVAETIQTQERILQKKLEQRTVRSGQLSSGYARSRMAPSASRNSVCNTLVENPYATYRFSQDAETE